MIAPHRRHALWLYFWIHRTSGLLLAMFLPFHFLVLSMALTDIEALDGFLLWSEQPPVRFAESVLVLLLALHFFGGLRLLVMELLPFRDWQKTAAALAALASLCVALGYLLTPA